MKKIVALIVATSITVMAGTAMAATANLDVSATVTPTCTMNTDAGTLAFGSLDPTAPVAKTASSSGVTITCTNGTAYTLVGNDGANPASTQKRLRNGTTTNYIPYSVTIPSSGTGSGSAVPISIAGLIAENSYSTAPAGSYADTIILTVTPVTP